MVMYTRTSIRCAKHSKWGEKVCFVAIFTNWLEHDGQIKKFIFTACLPIWKICAYDVF